MYTINYLFIIHLPNALYMIAYNLQIIIIYIFKPDGIHKLF